MTKSGGSLLPQLLALLLFASGLPSSWQVSTPASPTYRAGVVEVKPVVEGTSNAAARATVEEFKRVMALPEAADLDILVFPEHVLLDRTLLTTYVPGAADQVIPCDTPNYEYSLVELSCLARSYHLYIVVNLVEKATCAQEPLVACPASGMLLFNTNIVFDRQGRVVSRYRKSHLYKYEWYSTNVLAQPELASFETDFGVTFGHFICFDMLFWAPAMQLVRERNITDVIYPTFWYNELPFLTAVQLQESWSFANDVNLLAADGSVPDRQNTGSGIYAGRLGRLQAVIQEEARTRLLVATVPKRDRRAEQPVEVMPPVPLFVPQLQTARYTKVQLLRDHNVDVFATLLLDANFTSVTNQRVCHNAFCCTFGVQRALISELSTHAAYRYRLAAYSGEAVTFQRGDQADLSVCAVIACTSAELNTCGYIFPGAVAVANKFYFQQLNVSGEFRHAPRRLIMPTSVDGVLMPLPVGQYDWIEQEGLNSTAVSIGLTSPKSDLLTFGIWANYHSLTKNTHNLDAPLALRSSAATTKFSPLLLLVFLLLSLTASSRLVSVASLSPLHRLK